MSFDITVANEGTLTADAVVVTDRPDDGLIFSALNSATVTDNGDGTFTLAEPLAAGASTTFNVSYVIDADFVGTSLVNVAEITGDDGDDFDSTPDNDTPSEDDQDEAEVPVNQTYDLTLTKAITSDGPYAPGSTVSFDITVANEGTLTADAVVVTDRPDDGLTFSALNSATATDNGDGTFTLNGSLAAGASTTFNVSYVIDGDFMGTSLANVAEITGDDGEDTDSTPDNDVSSEDDQDAVEVPVGQTYDLALTKTITSDGPYAPGSTVSFDITVANEGTLTADAVVVTDRPADGLTFSALNSATATDNGDGTFTLNGSLAAGASTTFNVSYVIDGDFMGTSLANVAEITGDDGEDTDSTPDNDVPSEDDQDAVEVPVGQTYDLALTKTITSDGPYAPGSTVSFDITVANEGTLTADAVVVTDRPDGRPDLQRTQQRHGNRQR